MDRPSHSTHRVRLAEQPVYSDLPQYLHDPGLPAVFQWWVLPASRWQDHHVLDFEQLGSPTDLESCLKDSGIPTWFCQIFPCDCYVVIGSWTVIRHNGTKTFWNVCINRDDESLVAVLCSREDYDVVGQLEGLPVSDASIASSLPIGRDNRFRRAARQCYALIASTPEKLEPLLDTYFRFLCDHNVSPQDAINRIGHIDPLLDLEEAIWPQLISEDFE